MKIIFNKWEKDKKMIINFLLFQTKKVKEILYIIFTFNDYLRKYKFLFKRWILS